MLDQQQVRNIRNDADRVERCKALKPDDIVAVIGSSGKVHKCFVDAIEGTFVWVAGFDAFPSNRAYMDEKFALDAWTPAYQLEHDHAALRAELVSTLASISKFADAKKLSVDELRNTIIALKEVAGKVNHAQ